MLDGKVNPAHTATASLMRMLASGDCTFGDILSAYFADPCAESIGWLTVAKIVLRPIIIEVVDVDDIPPLLPPRPDVLSLFAACQPTLRRFVLLAAVGNCRFTGIALERMRALFESHTQALLEGRHT